MPIQFKEEPDVNEITAHSRSAYDDLYYEDDEIAEFRYQAFMVECGLEQDDIPSTHTRDNDTLDDIMKQLSHSSMPVAASGYEDTEQKKHQQQTRKSSAASPTNKPSTTVTTPKSRNRISKFKDLINRRRVSSPMKNTPASAAAPNNSSTNRPSKPPVSPPNARRKTSQLQREADAQFGNLSPVSDAGNSPSRGGIRRKVAFNDDEESYEKKDQNEQTTATINPPPLLSPVRNNNREDGVLKIPSLDTKSENDSNNPDISPKPKASRSLMAGMNGTNNDSEEEQSLTPDATTPSPGTNASSPRRPRHHRKTDRKSLRESLARALSVPAMNKTARTSNNEVSTTTKSTTAHHKSNSAAGILASPKPKKKNNVRVSLATAATTTTTKDTESSSAINDTSSTVDKSVPVLKKPKARRSLKVELTDDEDSTSSNNNNDEGKSPKPKASRSLEANFDSTDDDDNHDGDPKKSLKTKVPRSYKQESKVHSSSTSSKKNGENPMISQTATVQQRTTASLLRSTSWDSTDAFDGDVLSDIPTTSPKPKASRKLTSINLDGFNNSTDDDDDDVIPKKSPKPKGSRSLLASSSKGKETLWTLNADESEKTTAFTSSKRPKSSSPRKKKKKIVKSSSLSNLDLSPPEEKKKKSNLSSSKNKKSSTGSTSKKKIKSKDSRSEDKNDDILSPMISSVKTKKKKSTKPKVSSSMSDLNLDASEFGSAKQRKKKGVPVVVGRQRSKSPRRPTSFRSVTSSSNHHYDGDVPSHTTARVRWDKKPLRSRSIDNSDASLRPSSFTARSPRRRPKKSNSVLEAKSTASRSLLASKGDFDLGGSMTKATTFTAGSTSSPTEVQKPTLTVPNSAPAGSTGTTKRKKKIANTASIGLKSPLVSAPPSSTKKKIIRA